MDEIIFGIFTNLSDFALEVCVSIDMFNLMRQRQYIQLLSKIFIDSDFCHNYLHTLYLFECL